jgi:hypothetical protein
MDADGDEEGQPACGRQLQAVGSGHGPGGAAEARWTGDAPRRAAASAERDADHNTAAIGASVAVREQRQRKSTHL